METSGTSPSNANSRDRNRRKVLHSYRDHAQATFPLGGGEDDKRNGPRGGAGLHFPIKLHAMLSNAEDLGLSHVVSWQPHGRCFVVHKMKEFLSEVLPIYFRQTKFTSFRRQLNIYGFSRITRGRDQGGYYHELFLRHRSFLCHHMARSHIKGTGTRGKTSPETEPDFYSMPWVKPGRAYVASNQDLRGEVAAAAEEENKRSESTERQDYLSAHSLLIAQSLRELAAAAEEENKRSEPTERQDRDSYLSIAQSIREPILTPSSSSSSLSVITQPDRTIEINPDTIFTEPGDWEVGGVNVDIDAEFKTMGGG